MEATDVKEAALAALSDTSNRLTELIATLPDATAPTALPDWTVREVVAHLLVETEPCIELALGAAAPYTWAGAAEFNAGGAKAIADIPETDPTKLAGLVGDVLSRFVTTAAGQPADGPVDFFGFPFTVAQLVGLALGEYLVHGYDVAAAVGRPWRIDPVHAQLALHGYAPCFGMCLHKVNSAGHTAGYGIDLRGGEGMTARFVDGVFSLEPPGGPVDCTISADPAALLMVGVGRITRWQAIAFGLLSVGGDRPDLGLGYFDLFDAP
jgi:uncharacterized protein (TIGR03083 family)